MSDHMTLLVRDLREVAQHLDAGFDKACAQAADLIEVQATQLAERDREIERREADRFERVKERIVLEAQRDALLKAATPFVALIDRMNDQIGGATNLWPATPLYAWFWGDAALLNGADFIALRDASAIQPGDSHER